jgi:small subunit ribosomal protein S17
MADANDNKRGFGRTLKGVVSSDKMQKTITVVVERTVPHKYYGKYIKRRAKYHAHDENNVANIGDTVQIVEARPTSKTKRWRLQKVIEKARI